jgi:hypothetical protein
MTAVDRSSVRRGDTISWRNLAGDGEASGVVVFKTAAAATVTAAGLRLPVDWRRVCGHQPREEVTYAEVLG